MRNSRGIEIKKGYHAWTERGIDGRVKSVQDEYAILDLENGRSEKIVHVDAISQVLPPMRITRGGVVKANPDSIHIDIDSHNTKGRNVRAKNPVTEARELWLYARNRWPIVNEARAAFQSNASAAKWKSIALKAARDYSAEFGNGSSRWRDIFTDDDLSVTASMLRDDMQNEAEDDAQYAGNPTPRLTRYDQPSQRERINPRTGRPTKAPSKRLKERRLKTHHFAPEGVWANPLTRVKLKSPAQRSGEVPEKGSRLYKRRQTTAKAPAGFYANPLETRVKFGDALADAAAPDTMRDHGEYFFVQWKNEGERKWTTQKIFDTYAEAEKYAKAWHRQVPSIYIRVVNKSPATGREKYAHHLR